MHSVSNGNREQTQISDIQQSGSVVQTGTKQTQTVVQSKERMLKLKRAFSNDNK
jgi:hypothetical protein